MPQSLTKVYVHIVFSTKYREHLLHTGIQDELYGYLGGICNQLGCYPVKIGGFTDHVHVLCMLSKKVALMDLLKELKRGSSIWIKTKGKEFSNFHWQDGYGAFSVNPSELDVVSEYIATQEDHHKKKTFQEEYVAFLKKCKVDYDERYVWG